MSRTFYPTMCTIEPRIRHASVTLVGGNPTLHAQVRSRVVEEIFKYGHLATRAGELWHAPILLGEVCTPLANQIRATEKVLMGCGLATTRRLWGLGAHDVTSNPSGTSTAAAFLRGIFFARASATSSFGAKYRRPT